MTGVVPVSLSQLRSFLRVHARRHLVELALTGSLAKKLRTFLWHSGDYLRIACSVGMMPSATQKFGDMLVWFALEGTEQAVEASRLRPITVFPVLCRLVVGTWVARSSVRSWLDHVTPPSFHGGIQGHSAWGAIAALDSAWSSGRVLISLDLKQCFDRIVPELADPARTCRL